MITTERYGFRKPEPNDYLNVDDLNFNADRTEEALKDIDGRLKNSVVVTLPASKWTAAAPYGLVVEVPGIKETDQVGIHLYTPKTLPSDEIKLRQKQTPMITSGVSSDGHMTFWCGVKRPIKDFQVLLTGVSAQEGGE